MAKLSSVIFLIFLSTIQCLDIYTDLVFHEIGSYKDNSYDSSDEWPPMSNGTNTKYFYAPRNFKSDWMQAQGVCKNYGMELATFETKEEMKAVTSMCKKYKSLYDGVHIGGMAIASKLEFYWYWVNSGNRISYDTSVNAEELKTTEIKYQEADDDHSWTTEAPHHPQEFCLALKTENFTFSDVPCYGGQELPFMCQKS